MTVLSMFVHSKAVSKLWELDVVGIQDPSRRSNEEAEMAVQAYFHDTVKVNDDGWYEVRLPWIEGHPPVPRNINVAKKRIQEIRSLTMKEAWRHVPGAMNPADLPSCGCFVRQLLDFKWWEGPPWLKLPPEDWSSRESQLDEDMVMQERRKTVVSSLLCKDVKADWYYSFSNDYDKSLLGSCSLSIAVINKGVGSAWKRYCNTRKSS
jgi:hypothetical protein